MIKNHASTGLLVRIYIIIGLFFLIPLSVWGNIYGIEKKTSQVGSKITVYHTVYIDKSLSWNTGVEIPEKKGVYQLVTHGRSGELFIEGEWKGSKQIAEFLLSKIQNSITCHSEPVERLSKGQYNIQYVYIYGCEFAKGDKGKQAIAYLERQLGVKIAASTNITGIDGDYILEVGHIDVSTVFKGFQGNLQCDCPDGATTVTSGTYTTLPANNVCIPAGENVTFSPSIPINEAIEIQNCGTFTMSAPSGVSEIVLTGGNGSVTNFSNMQVTNLATVIESGAEFNNMNSQSGCESISVLEGGVYNRTGAFNGTSYYLFNQGTADLTFSNDSGGFAFQATSAYLVTSPSATTTYSRTSGTTSVSNGFTTSYTTFNQDAASFPNISDDFENSYDYNACGVTSPLVYGNEVCDDGIDNNWNGQVDEDCPTVDCTDITLPECDFDGDGVVNQVDIDDDNDGVLDVDEMEECPDILEGVVDGSAESAKSVAWSENTNTGSLNSTLGATGWTPIGSPDTWQGSFSLIGSGFWGGAMNGVPETPDGEVFFGIYNGFLDEGMSTEIPESKGIQIGDVIQIDFYQIFGGTNGITPLNAQAQLRFTVDGQPYLADMMTYNGNNPKTWEEVSLSFTATSTSPNITIDVLPVGTNDGNYLGIDGIKIYNLTSLCAGITDIDTDNDGIFNRLDPDSDGDGCSDSYEAGAIATENIDNQFTGTDTNDDGLVDEVDADNDGVPDYTSTYNQYALSNNLDLCADTDGDGIADLVDIDDDNDGILDATESPGCFFQSFDFISGNRSEHITVTTDLNMNASYQNPGELVDGDNGTAAANYAVQFINSQANTGANIYTFEFETPVELTNIYLRYVNGSSHFVNGAVAQLRGSNDGENWTDLNTGATYNQNNENGSIDPVPGTMRYNQFEVTQNQGRYRYYQIYGVSGTIWSGGTSNEVYFQLPPDFSASSYPKVDCTSDTDSDGVYNHHDLDSDGDGCSDSYEAGGIDTENPDNQFTGTDTNSDGLVDEVDADQDGVPDYQYQSYAYTDSLNLCADTDGDDVGDLVDIDDDNDGVPDSTETTDDCRYVGAKDLSTYTFNNVASVNADFDENNNLSLNRINGTWVSTYSYQTVSVPLYLEFTVDDINSNSMVGIIEENANISSNNYTDQSHKFNFNTNDDYNIRDFGSAALNADTYLPGDIFSIEVDEEGNLSMKKNGAEVYADVVTGTNFRLVFSTASATAKIYSNMVFGNINEMVYACEDMDTDGDGTPNRLDLDSDGDGCSDSFEAEAIATENPDNQFTGEVGTNGLVDSLETTADSGEINYTSTYSQYALSDNLNLCADTDGDGIADLVDIDDDNDGILDATESSACFFKSSDFVSGNRNENITVTTDLNMNATYQNPEELVDGDNGTAATSYAVQFINSQSNTGANIYTFEFATPTELTNIYLQYINANTHFINGAVAQLRGSNDGENWTDLNTGATYNQAAQSGVVLDIPGTISYHQFEVAQNQGRYKYYQIYGVSGTIWSGGTSNEVYFQLPPDFSASSYPKTDCTSDTDSDGVYNHHDLDSDGDGCSDSYEAGAIATENPDNQFTGEVGTNGLVNSVETTADSGEINYTSTYSQYALSDNLNLCADTDGDGIGDLTDIDDDNDGVLDTTESPDCFYLFEELSEIQGVSTTIPTFNTTTWGITSTIDGDPGTAVQYNLVTSNVGEEFFRIELLEPVSLSGIEMEMGAYGISQPSGTYVNTTMLQGSIDGTTWDNLESAASSKTVVNGIETIGITENIGASYKYYRLLGVTGRPYYGRIEEIMLVADNFQSSLYPKADCTSDIDGDGVYNHHDPDSDGDGCSDSFEAGAIDTENPDNQFTGEVGINGLLDSLETPADSGEINYTSTYKFYGQNANLNLCGDTDDDGVGDLIDLDDDNDGILDTDEGACPNGISPESAFTNLSQIRNAPSGRYYFDLGNGVFQGDVDNSEDGGWLLVLQYVHQGGTNPALTILTSGSNFPVTSEASLGTNEATITENWGHAGNAALNQFSEDFEIRFYGETSNHSRIIHFKTTLGTDYVKTGTGSFDGIQNTDNHTLLSGHTANLPEQASEEFLNQNDQALTNFPFYLNATYHWGISGNGNRWEVDDFLGNSSINTIHRVWIRAATLEPPCEPLDTDGDNIPNYLDLDSDGDGCPDALEGDGGFTFGDLTTSEMDGGNTGGTSYAEPVQDNLGNDVDANGVPNVVAPDGQGIGISQEQATDTDEDGIGDTCDCFDNTQPDTDADGVPDYADVDSDNDGIANINENTTGLDPYTDTDADGVPLYLDDDDNNEFVGNADGLPQPGFDTDADGVANHLDLDSDNDGIPDTVEATGDETIAICAHADGDVIDTINGCETGESTGGLVAPIDTDTDGTPDYLDLDSDEDGCPDGLEAGQDETNVNTIDYAQVTSSGIDVNGLVTVVGCVSPTTGDWIDNTVNDSCCEIDETTLVATPTAPSTCSPADDGYITISEGNLFPSTDYLISYQENGFDVGPLIIPTDASGSLVIAGLMPGEYTQITITSTSYPTICQAVIGALVTVPEFANSMTVDTAVTNVSCFGGNNGAILLAVNGGSGNYSYSWTTTNGGGVVFGAEDQTTLQAGDYTVAVTDTQTQCTLTVENVTVAQPTAEVSGTTIQTNVQCFGDANGAIDLTPAGGTPPYSYSWTSFDGNIPSGQEVVEDLSGLIAGTYTAVITDANGCTNPNQINVTLTQPNELTLGENQSGHQNIVCDNGDIGAFSVTAGGGSGTGYEYSLDQTDWTNTTGVFENLSAGTYNVWVRDSNACISGPLPIVIDLYCVEAVKTQALNDVDGSGGVTSGDIITYTIAIENTGTTTVGYNMTVDHFQDLQGRTLQFDSGPTFTGADQGSGQGTILAGETASYTATYTWMQADVDAGGLSNQAEFVIDPPTGTDFGEISDDDGGAVDTNNDGNPDNDPTVYPVGQITEIRLVKTANFNDENNDGCTDVGETITYDFTVSNPGSVTLDNVDISDPLLANITFNSGDVNSDDELDVSETWIYRGTYTIMQDDIDTGTISNQATVTSNAPNGASVSDLSGATATDNLPTETSLCQDSGLVLVKEASFNDENGDGCTDVDETMGYTLTLTNTGNVSLSNISLTDPLLSSTILESGDTDNDTVLDISETWTYTGTYTITQDDIDTGTISNQATATASAPGGISVSDLSGATATDNLPTETSLCQDSDLVLVKEASFNDENGDGCTDVDETIGYTLTLTNTGNVSLSNISLTDPLLSSTILESGDTDNDTVLDVSETWIYRGTYTITQDDIDTGTISNQATATASAPDGTSVSDLSGATATDNLPTETSLCQDSGLVLVKEASFNDENGDGCTDVDETMGYTLTLTNTGNVSLSNISLTDPLLSSTILESGDTDNDTVLDISETWIYRGTYTITQDDIDTGTISNQATATASAPDGTSVSDLSGTTDADDLPTETALCQEIAMGLVKTGIPNDENGDGCDNVGETIAYTFTLTNTGNVSLNNVGVTDNLLLETVAFDSGDLDGDTDLDVGETWTYTGSYRIAQEDLDAGTVSNQATATASAPGGTSVSDLSGATAVDNLPTETTLCENPAIELNKEASVSDPDNSEDISVGDVITYTFTLTNTGNVTISGLTYTDNLTDADGSVLGLTTGIRFISSTGGSDGTEIAPGEVITYRATYQIEQGVVDAGGVSNTATVNGTTLQGTDVSDVSDDGDPTDTDGDGDSDNDPTVTSIVRVAGLTLIKTASEVIDIDDNGQDVGDRVTYTFRIENAGNVTISGLVLTDPLFVPSGTDLILDETTLIPGQVSNFSVDYLLTATDIGNGEVVNSATITGTDPEGASVSDVSDNGDPMADDDDDGDFENDPTIVDLDIPASLSLIKTATLNDENGDGLAQEGETITYSFTVTNTGNIDIIGLVIDDPALFTPAEAVSPSELPPGEEGTITDFVYTITQLDVDAGSTSNTATVTGQRIDDDTDVTDISDDGNPTNGNNNPTVTPLPNEATVTLLKEGTYSDSNGDGMANVGDEIIYNFTVTNPGNVTLDNLVLTDNFLPAELDLTLSPTSIAPAETATAQVIYPIIQADVDAGQVSNRALVTGDDPNGNEVTADSDNGEGTGATVVPLTKEPSLNLIKTSEVTDTNSSGRDDAGDVVTYTFTVTNTGNVTVDMLTIEDPRISVSNLAVNPSTLEPDETGTATATYTVTQLDMNRGSITNTATVNGLDPSDNPVEDISDNGTGTGDTPTITPLTVEPGIEVVKTQTVTDSNGDGITGSVGDVISYTIRVTNPGNVTLRAITVTDIVTDIDGGTLSLDSGPTFDSGNSDNIQGILQPSQQAVYTASYTLTQSDVNAGGVSNSVDVQGTTQSGTTTANDAIDFLIAENPVLEVEKTASISDQDNDGTTNAGDIITYTILIHNAGNVTLTNVGLTDTLTDMDNTLLTLDSGPTFVSANDGSLEGTLNPMETVIYTATYTLTQSDVNAGGVSNTAMATATSPEDTSVEDISDDGDPANGEDNSTDTLIEKAPELTLIKTVNNVTDTDGSSDNNVGDVVTYTFSIENTGNVTIDNLVLTDDFLPGTTNLTVTPSTLDPGEEAVVSVNYVLTQDDIDLGEIINSATISGTDPDTEAVTDVSDDGDPADSDLDPDTDGDNDPTYLNLTTEASLYFDKVATVNDEDRNGQVDAGETITYDFTVKNNGNITVENITFDDPNLGLTDVPITPSTLGPDQTGTGVQAQYIITQADIDAGFVINDAIASGDRVDGNGSVSDNSDDGNPLNGGDNPTRTDFDQKSSISLLKRGTYTDANGDGVANVGDHITYDFAVTNTGNTTVSEISVADARIGLASPGQNTTPDTLAPGEEGSLSITYPITQSDLNRRLVTNTATGEGTSPDGSPVTTTSNTVVVLLPKQPSLEHIKTSQLIDTNGNGVDDVGDQIEYTFTVTNTGNVTITVLSIDDPAIGVSNLGLVPSTLDPGEQGSATAVYDITQADVDAGEVVNSALVSGNDPDGETVDDPSDDGGGGDDPTVTQITAEPSYTAVKTQTVANTNTDIVTGGVGDRITYTISVENIGNVTLTGITLTGDTFQDLRGNTLSLDSGPSFVGADQGSPEGTLMPYERATYTATYIITKAAVDGGGLSNQATFRANPPSGAALTVISDDGDTTNGNEDPTLFPIEEMPELEVIKKSLPITDTDNSGTTTAGDILTFRITVANRGNVTLNTLALIDTLTDANGTPLTLDSEPTFISSDEGSIEGTLVAGETGIYEATYTLQQSDINSGGVINTVTATALSPGGTSAEDVSDDGDALNGSDTPTEVDFKQAPVLTLIKTSRVIDENDNDANDADDTIEYTFTVTNTGNVTVDNLALNDVRLSAIPTLIPTSLDPGESATAIFSYDIQQRDINNGRVVNRAIVIGTDPDGEEVRDLSDDGRESDADNDGNPNNDPTITDLITEAKLELVKTATYDPVDGRADVGETITYTFTVTNTGYVTVENLSIEDPLLEIEGEAITPSAINPGEELTITITSNTSYIITQEDIDNGEVSNTATVNGLYVANSETVTDISDEGDPTTGPDNPTVTPLPKAAEITLDKTGIFNDENSDGFADAGETVDYTFTIINSGNVTIDNLSLIDDFLPNGTDLTLSITTIPPGEVAMAAATYILTQTDVDNGEIINIAETTGTDLDGVETYAIDTFSVVLVQNPSLELIKTASDPNVDTNNSGHVDAGDQIVYTFDVTNTGNVTVNTLTITDPRLSISNLGLNPQILAPGESGTATYTYTITQADMDAGSITNTATVNGFDPGNGSVSDVSDNGTGDGDDPTITPITAESSYTVVKTQTVANINIDGVRGGVGDRITYTISVENTGNVTLTGITLTGDTFQDLQGNTLSLDSGPSFVSTDQSSPEGTLVPDERATYTATYIISQAAVDGGGLSNQAIFMANPPSGTATTVISDDGDTTNGNENPTVFPMEETPSIEVLKIANVNDTDTSGSITVGDVITYTITVENTGNVTVNNLNLTDTFTNGSGATLTPGFDRNSGASSEGTLAPGETAIYSVTYTLGQDDIDVGGVSNTVSATATSSSGIPVDDISDDGNPADSDGDGDRGNDPTETLVAENPSIEVEKTLNEPIVDTDGNGNNTEGDVVNFTINITNTGNVTLNNISLEDIFVDARGNTLGLTTGPDFESADGGSIEGILQVGETAMYTATYVLTQSEVDAGGISNGVIAKGMSVQGTEVRDKSDDGDDTDGNTTNDNTNVFIEENTGIKITKPQPGIVQNDGNTTIDVGDVLDYTIAITNIGNVTLRNLVVTDTIRDFNNIVLTPNLIPVFESSDINNTEGNLLPTETAIYRTSYTITQNNVDAGGLRNHAFVTSLSPNNFEITDISDDDIDDDGNTENDPTETEILSNPAIVIIKTANFNDENNDGCTDVGETITYDFTVSNPGSVTLDNVDISDPLLANITFNSGDVNSDDELDVSETWIYRGTYTIMQDDIDTGTISNQATVTSNAPNGASVSDLSGATATDNLPTETSLCQDSGLVLVKEASFNDENGDGCTDVDETMGYTLTLTNTGNVSLSNISLTDPLLSSTILESGDTDNDTVLDISETWTYTGTYTITQDDIDTGTISNQATATASAPGGISVSDLSGATATDNLPTETSLCQDSGLVLVKEASFNDENGDGCTDVDETMGYTLTLTNTGNVSLSNISLTDPLLSSTILESGDTDNDTVLDISETWIYRGTYTITQDDIDTGTISNQATATASAPDGTSVSDLSGTTDADDLPTETALCQEIAMGLVKTGIPNDENGDGCDNVGETIAYTFTLTNTGNVSLSNVGVTDNLLLETVAFDSGDLDGDTNLDVDETWTYTGSYTIAQEDLDTGTVSNQATATASAPSGTSVSDLSGTTNDNDDITETVLCQQGNISLEKVGTFNDANGNGFADIGETIDYNFTVTNTGNVTLFGIMITDDLVNVTGGALTLLPGASDSTTFTATYTVTAADIELGIVTNSAIVTGTDPEGSTLTDISDDPNNPTNIDEDGNGDPDDPTETVISSSAPSSLKVIKTAITTDNGDGVASAGDIIDYTITVTNTGDTEVDNIVLIDVLTNGSGNELTLTVEPIFASADQSSPEGHLELGETAEYLASYTLTQSDIDTGSVSNTVTGVGVDTYGIEVSDRSDNGDDADGNTEDDDTVVIFDTIASISLIKTAVFNNENGNGYTDVGETISYSFSVTNTGDVDLFDVAITDRLEGMVLAGTAIPILEVGQTDSTTYSGEYTLTEADMEKETIDNQAEAEGKDLLGNRAHDYSDDPNNPTDNDIDDDGDPDDSTDIVIVPEEEDCKVVVYDIISPNGDGIDDVLSIDGIDCYPNNTLEVYNRWGIRVFSTKNYGAGGETFRGYSDGRATVQRNQKLPTGTYYYILNYIDANGGSYNKAGPIFIITD